MIEGRAPAASLQQLNPALNEGGCPGVAKTEGPGMGKRLVAERLGKYVQGKMCNIRNVRLTRDPENPG